MESTEYGTIVHIKNARGGVRQLAFMMGFACGFFSLIVAISALAEDWRSVTACACLMTLFGALWWLACRILPEDVVILSRDGVTLPGNKMCPKFLWSDVERIRWPKRPNEDGRFWVVVRLANRSRLLSPNIPLDAYSISSADRLVLIRYLRLAGSSISQENWPTFCEWCAVPTAKRCEGDEGRGAPGETPAASKSWAGRVSR